MGRRRIGGGILATVGVVAPVVVEMTDIHIPSEWGIPLLGLCIAIAIFGLWMALAPEGTPHIGEKSSPWTNWEVEVSSGCLILLALPAILFIAWLISRSGG